LKRDYQHWQKIITKQPQALIKGLEYLLPLTQKQLALELDIGESTLSRLIKNKYMETPIGIIKIQDLFSANVGK
jgi:RNA polymerase sigma-54 factor